MKFTPFACAGEVFANCEYTHGYAFKMGQSVHWSAHQSVTVILSPFAG